MTKELSAKEKKKLEKAARRAKVVGDKGVDVEAKKAEAMRKKEEAMKKKQEEVPARQASPVPKESFLTRPTVLISFTGGITRASSCSAPS